MMRRFRTSVVVGCALVAGACGNETSAVESEGLIADVVEGLQARQGMSDEEALCLRERMVGFAPVADLQARVEQGDPDAHDVFLGELDRENLMAFARLLLGCTRDGLLGRAIADTGRDAQQQACLMDFVLEDDRVIGRIADGLMGDPTTVLLDPGDPESISIALDAMARCGAPAT